MSKKNVLLIKIIDSKNQQKNIMKFLHELSDY